MNNRYKDFARGIILLHPGIKQVHIQWVLTDKYTKQTIQCIILFNLLPHTQHTVPYNLLPHTQHTVPYSISNLSTATLLELAIYISSSLIQLSRNASRSNNIITIVASPHNNQRHPITITKMLAKRKWRDSSQSDN